MVTFKLFMVIAMIKSLKREEPCEGKPSRTVLNQGRVERSLVYCNYSLYIVVKIVMCRISGSFYYIKDLCNKQII